jgi:hypothetical protein
MVAVMVTDVTPDPDADTGDVLVRRTLWIWCTDMFLLSLAANSL